MTDFAPGYKILALGPFAPVPDQSYRPHFLTVDLYTMDDAVKAVSPVLFLQVPERLCPDGAVTLKFGSMKDFKPRVMLKNHPVLQSSLEDGKAGAGINGSEDKSSAGNSAVDDILDMVAAPGGQDKDVSGEKQTGEGLSGLMAAIYAHPEFRRTESAWLGVQNLVRQAQIKGNQAVRVSLATVSRDSLATVLDHVEELGSDEQPNLVLVDLEFDNTPLSMELLERAASFADRMMVPVCFSLNPAFFNIDTWDRFDKISYIKNHLDDMGYAKFRKLRQTPGAAWMMACCNPFAIRPATEYETMPLTASPVWAMGTLSALSVNDNGWPMAFSRYTRYRLTDLAMVDSPAKKPSATRMLLSEDRIHQLVEAGITPLAGAVKKDIAFIPVQTTLSGDSFAFCLFFNRVIAALVQARELDRGTDSPENEIMAGIENLFKRTGHEAPPGISVTRSQDTVQQDAVYLVSLEPPESIAAGVPQITFSFSW